jgi:Tfp pilus assembly protein PilV
MKIARHNHHGGARSGRRPGPAGFTMIEALIALSLFMLMMGAGFAAILTLDRSSRWLADHVSAAAIAGGRMEEVRSWPYSPPAAPFGSSTVTLTTTESIALDKAGVSFRLPGTVTTLIQPVAAGHLVTVTASFTNGSHRVSAQVQTVLNKHTGGLP